MMKQLSSKNKQKQAIDNENATIAVIFFVFIVHCQIFELKTTLTLL